MNASFKKKMSQIISSPDEVTFREQVKQLFSKDERDNFIAINIKIEIIYEHDESISLFSDYLMELDDKNKSFYFIYNYEIDLTSLSKIVANSAIHFIAISEEFSTLKIASRTNANKQELANKLNQLIEELDTIFMSSLSGNVYFADKNYENAALLPISTFQTLFNFKYLKATRLLNDEKTDNYYSISRELLDHFQLSDDWNSFKTQIISDIKEGLIKEELNEIVKNILYLMHKKHWKESKNILIIIKAISLYKPIYRMNYYWIS